MTSIVVPRHRSALLEEVRLDRDVGRHTIALAATIVIFGAVYGAVLGSWHGARLAFYVAIKIPLMLLLTAAITTLCNWILAALFGLPMRLRQIVPLTLLPLAIIAIVAASLAPVAWLFTTSLPPPAPSARTLHNLLYLTHTILIAAAGLAGTFALREVLAALCGGDTLLAARIRTSWIAIYAFVGGEVAWALRPFVGSVYLPVVFLRDDALDGNVYEFIFTDILPHLWKVAMNVLRSMDELLKRRDSAPAGHPVALLVGAVVCYLLYGIASGFFQGGLSLALPMLKIPIIILGSLALCVPSLYVFTALGGADVSARELASIVAGFCGIIGLILLALMPVIWLFSVSTISLGFVMWLHVLAWITALIFGRQFLVRANARASGTIGMWLALLFVVSLQMTTYVRPVLWRSEKEPLFAKGKKSFVGHLVEVSEWKPR